MADSSSDDKKARRRKPAAAASAPSKLPEKRSSPKKRSGKSVDEDEDAYSPWVDVFRVLTFLIIASAGLSYLVSGGETWLWYYGQTKPPYLTKAYWQAKFVRPQASHPRSPPKQAMLTYLAANRQVPRT